MIRKLGNTRSKDKTMTDEYFEIQAEYEEKFGEKTIVLYENGHFYEFYQIHNEEEKIGRASEIAELLNMLVSKKDKSIVDITRKNPQMAGFPTLALRRHLPVILDAGWTVVMVEQITTPPNPERAITAVYSKATYIENTDDATTNYLMCVYMEKIENKFLAGWSLIDCSTGFLLVHQIDDYTGANDYYCIEELNRIIVSFRPREYLFICSDMSKNDIEETFNITNVHYSFDVHTDYKKLSFQEALFKKVYPNHGALNVVEYLSLEKMDYTRISLVSLLQFCEKHGESIIKNLQIPEIWTSDRYLKIENNAIEQLDIITNNDKCLFRILNKTSTPMGKRLLHHRLLTPLINSTEITKRYTIVEELQNHYKIVNELMSNSGDIERLIRKISIGGIHPYEIYNLYYGLHKVISVLDYMIKYIMSYELFKPINYNIYVKKTNDFIKLVKDTFIIETLCKYNIKSISENMIKVPNDELQDLLNKNNKIEEEIKAMSVYLSELIGDKECVKVETTEKEGFYLKTTVKRGDILKKKTNEYTIDTSVKSCAKILSPEIKKKSHEYIANDHKIIKINQESFNKFIIKIQDYIQPLQKMVQLYADVDFLKCLSQISVENHYVKPEITNRIDYAFISAKEIRHPIVEKVNENIKYIANDCYLGETSQDGMLVFGINGIGKSVYLKSVAINVLMAQIGGFVAASSFTYSPFRSLLTRISSNDNLYKGHSSFIVEMLELKSILARSNPYSLVIADELTHGTETQSGTAIICATVIKLAEQGAKFIFTTHLHSLSKMDRIKNLNNLGMYHMKVEYKPDTDELIYHRKLKSGSGIPLYGLECCKGLHMDKSFMELATEIRKEILGEPKGIIDPENKSKYNSNFYNTECVICGGTQNIQTHHIEEQHMADPEGYIEYFHKDSKFNLVSLCDKCHQNLHKGLYKIDKVYTNENGIKMELKEIVNVFRRQRSLKFTEEQLGKIIELKGSIGISLARKILKSEYNIDISEKTIKNYWYTDELENKKIKK